jgi:2-deoxy-D-gluconate 3-dehydrogenase
VLSLSLDGKIAVITGAGRGLGAAAARALAEAGADVALLARSASELERTAADIERLHHRRTFTLALDVTDEQAVARAAEQVVAKLGRVDVLVNNAGIAHEAPLLELTLADLKRILDVNVVGAFLCARAFGAHLVKQRKGTIINIASIAGLGGEPELSAYCASKGALISFTKALAVEWARHGVTVNAVAPGWFRTDINQSALDDPNVGPKIVKRIPMRRVGQPEELGPLIAYLASDAAAFMTGSVVVIDGGQLAR